MNLAFLSETLTTLERYAPTLALAMQNLPISMASIILELVSNAFNVKTSKDLSAQIKTDSQAPEKLQALESQHKDVLNSMLAIANLSKLNSAEINIKLGWGA